MASANHLADRYVLGVACIGPPILCSAVTHIRRGSPWQLNEFDSIGILSTGDRLVVEVKAVAQPIPVTNIPSPFTNGQAVLRRQSLSQFLSRPARLLSVVGVSSCTVRLSGFWFASWLLCSTAAQRRA